MRRRQGFRWNAEATRSFCGKTSLRGRVARNESEIKELWQQTYVRAYVHTCIQTYRHTDMQTGRQTHRHTYMHTVCVTKKCQGSPIKVPKKPRIIPLPSLALSWGPLRVAEADEFADILEPFAPGCVRTCLILHYWDNKSQKALLYNIFIIPWNCRTKGACLNASKPKVLCCFG